MAEDFTQKLKTMMNDYSKELKTMLERKDKIINFTNGKFLNSLNEEIGKINKAEENLKNEYTKDFKSFMTKLNEEIKNLNSLEKDTSSIKKTKESFDKVVECCKQLSLKDEKSNNCLKKEIYTDLQSFLQKNYTEKTLSKSEGDSVYVDNEKGLVFNITAEDNNFNIIHNDSNNLNSDVKNVTVNNKEIKAINFKKGIFLETFIDGLKQLIYTYKQEVKRENKIKEKSKDFLDKVTKKLKYLSDSFKETLDCIKKSENIKTDKETGKTEIKEKDDNEVKESITKIVENFLNIRDEEGNLGNGKKILEFGTSCSESELSEYYKNSSVKKIKEIVQFIVEGLYNLEEPVINNLKYKDGEKEINLEKESETEVKKCFEKNTIENLKNLKFSTDYDKIYLILKGGLYFINGQYILNDNKFVKKEETDLYFSIFDNLVEISDDIKNAILDYKKGNFSFENIYISNIYKGYVSYIKDCETEIKNNIKKMIDEENSTGNAQEETILKKAKELYQPLIDVKYKNEFDSKLLLENI